MLKYFVKKLYLYRFKQFFFLNVTFKIIEAKKNIPYTKINKAPERPNKLLENSLLLRFL